MKKLILIIILAGFAFTVQSQGLYVNFNNTPKTVYPAYTVDGDSTWVQSLNNQYYFDYEFTWTGLDQTDGSIKIQVKNKSTGGAWNDYPNLDSLLLNSAAGTAHIRDMTNGTLNDSIRAKLDSGTCAAGTLYISANLGTKR